MRVVRKLTRVMKTQWNYNKPIAKLIRSPGRRPFNNKTRTYLRFALSWPTPFTRFTCASMFTCVRMPFYTHAGCTCVCVCKRINFSRAFMLSDWPNYGFLRFVHTCRTFLYEFRSTGVCVCVRARVDTHLSTHPHLEKRPTTCGYRCENTFDQGASLGVRSFLPGGGRLLQRAKFQNTLMASVHQGNRITQWSNTRREREKHGPRVPVHSTATSAPYVPILSIPSKCINISNIHFINKFT